MNITWRTAWQGQDIVVYREKAGTEEELDRLHAPSIERVIFVYRSTGETLSDICYALVQLPDELVVFPLETGFAGRVHFERQAFWAEKANVYWAIDNTAPLPLKSLAGRWWWRPKGPSYSRMSSKAMLAALENWPVEGPQTWEQRKWASIAKNQPFANFGPIVTARP
jgi:hypothetical protein